MKKLTFLAYVTPVVSMGSLKKCQPIWFSRLASYSYHLNIQIQGYPHKMRLQRRSYRNYTVCFLRCMIPCNCLTCFFFPKPLNNPLEDCILGRGLNLIAKSSFMSFTSSWQSHPLWVTLYIYIWIYIFQFLTSHFY